MTDDQWKAAFEIIRQAERLPVAERSECTARQISDPDLRALVLDLLSGDSPESVTPGTELVKQFGDYEITSELGRGGMSRVYAACHLESGQRVALKVLAPELVAESRSVRRLLKEAKAASALNHPNIVKVFGVVRSGDDVAIAMELLEGEALRQRCHAAQQPEMVARWGAQVARALAAAHQNNIVHCDIKPENLMLGLDGNIKVVDFGLARRLFSGASTESIAVAGGTVEYFAPEQVSGHCPTSATDVFALGVVLYELSTGRHPFSGQTPFDTLHNISKQTPIAAGAFHSAASRRLSKLILRMLEKDPELRPGAGETDRALRDVSEAPRTSRRGPIFG